MVFLESLYEVLLMVHLVTTFVLVGSMSHNLLCVLRYVRGKFVKQRSELRFLKISLWSYVIVYIFGVLIYPAFRIYIRGAYFDPEVSWATGLFEVKEHWAALGLAFFFVYYFMRKTLKPEQERDKLFLYVPLCVIINIITWYTIIIGGWLSLLKGAR